MNENEEFVREFLVECDENLDQLDQDLVALESEPRDSKRLQSIFRTIHTIKGTSGFFGFSKLGALAHDGESLLGRLRDGELLFNQQIATALLELVDGIREILASIEKTNAEGDGDYRDLSAKLIRSALSPAEETVVPDADEPPAREAEIDTVPPVATEPGESDSVGRETEADSTANHTVVTEGIVPRADRSDQPVEAVADAQQPADRVPPEPSPSATWEGSIRVDVRLLDSLMDLAGELVLARNQLNQFSPSLNDGALQNAIQRLSLITSELQAGVTQTRMQPMSTIWSKFPRVVRDLAVSCGKEVRLQQEGEDTELDRSLLEAIKDPLTHLIRNAVDHGIESPAVRESRCKPRQGRVLLRAFHESGRVNIEIVDDGGGIDVQRVKQKAVEQGLMRAEQAGIVSEHEILQWIFRPGFSTSAEITDVSGRGVGMDVVKTNIEKIGGTIDLHSRPGLGATVHITIPLTLAIIPALVVTTGRDRFAIPQAAVTELLNYRAAAGPVVEWVHDAPVCRLRGELLPLVYLHQILELEDAPNRDGNVLNIVVLQAEGRRLGLVVDQVANTEEIVVKPLGSALQSIQVFAGATIMGDGAVALILDVAGLARRAGMSLVKIEGEQLEETADEADVVLTPAVLCEVGDGGRIAVRLAEVERLEVFPASEVEHAAGKEAIQYRDEIMPLVRMSQFRGRPSDAGSRADNLMVVVHRQRERNAGLVVSRILDIVACPPVIEPSQDESGVVVGSTVIDGHVTDWIDLAHVFRAAGLHFVNSQVDSV